MDPETIDLLDDPVVATTQYGTVRGAAIEGLAMFKGIPYAAPPVGRLRFRPPRPPESWTGVRDALRWGPIAAQAADPLERYGAEPDELDSTTVGMPIPVFTSEDSLYLNVWTPALDGAARPVMVFIHGGAFVVGSTSCDYYTGEHLARHDVVVVTFNYRLGVFGFLELGSIDETLRGSGNNGLRDQIAALRWVRRNIAAFGGDPENVTVFGESAGSISICALLATARPDELFDRVIPQSGGPNLLHTASFQDRAARAVIDAANQIGVDDLATASALQLVESGYVAASSSPYADTLFAPYIDGELVLGEPYELLRSGHAAGVTMLTGATQDEMGYWSMYDSQLRNYFVEESDFGSPIGLPASLRALLDDALAPATIDSIYADWVSQHNPPRGRRDDAATILHAQIDDYVMIQPMTRLAEAQLDHAPTYMYRFAWKVPALVLDEPEQDLGAIHALELSFVFGTGDIISPGGDRLLEDAVQRDRVDAMSSMMRQAWTNFARTGGPSGGEVPNWPPYDLTDRATMVFRNDAQGELDVSVVGDPDRTRREVWLAHPFAPFT